jgi:hypothetical protein
MFKEDIIYKVYCMLEKREIQPTGEFDKAGRWWAKNKDLINVRCPSHKWRYSQMTACRTLKYVEKVYDKFECKTIEELITKV